MSRTQLKADAIKKYNEYVDVTITNGTATLDTAVNPGHCWRLKLSSDTTVQIVSSAGEKMSVLVKPSADSISVTLTGVTLDNDLDLEANKPTIINIVNTGEELLGYVLGG